MIRNLRYAWRALRRSPIFLTMAVATFGLGVAATTAVSSLFYQVLLRELPVRDPEQLVVFHQNGNLPGHSHSDNFESIFSDPMYRRLRDRSGSIFEGLIARSSAEVNVTRNGASDQAQVEIVSGNFFQVLGVRSFAGRLFTPSDDTLRGANDVAVLGYAYWQRHYGSTNVVGQKVLINRHPIVIVGVAPPDFRSVLSGQTPDLYMPISMYGVANPDFSAFDNPGWHWLTIVGRLRPGVSRRKAQAALNPLFTSTLRDELAAWDIRSAHSRQRILSDRLELNSAAEGLNSLERSWKKPLLVLIGAAAGLLLIACSNLASLLMARAATRQREIAIRRSVGATRPQVVSQLLTESILLALLGSVLGIFLALALTRGILYMLPADATGGWVDSGLSWPILVFTLLVSLLSGVLFGILPAWQVSAEHAASVLRNQAGHASSSASHARWRRAAVILQIALSVVLLVGAGLFTKSFAKLLHHNPGFHTENLLTFTLDPGLNRYTTSQALNLYAQLRDRLSQSGPVTAISFCEFGPYSDSNASTNVSVDGYHPGEDENMDSGTNLVAPGFFHTLGIPILAGREFTAADAASAPKRAVVNQAFVRRFLPGRNAIGVRMSVGAGGPLDIQIVGVVPDAQLASLREDPKPFYYLAFLRAGKPPDPANQAVFLIRTRTADAALPAVAREMVHSFDSALPVTNMEKLQVQIANSVYQDRALAMLTSACGLLALLLASLGLYGVVAYAVSRRTAEIGIRMALGAHRFSIVSLVLREVIWMVSAGAVIGVMAGLLLSRAIASQLFGVEAMDASVFVSAVAILFVIALGAAAGPTLRATRVDPIRTLRYD